MRLVSKVKVTCCLHTVNCQISKFKSHTKKTILNIIAQVNHLINLRQVSIMFKQ